MVKKCFCIYSFALLSSGVLPLVFFEAKSVGYKVFREYYYSIIIISDRSTEETPAC